MEVVWNGTMETAEQLAARRPAPPIVTAQPIFLDDVYECLLFHGPMTARHLQERLLVSPTQVNGAIYRLKELGRVIVASDIPPETGRNGRRGSFYVAVP